VIVRQYPSYDDLYRFGFVHTRVAGYAQQGLPVDVFRLRNESAVSFQEYRNVDVITGSSADLQRLLEDGHHRSLLVHFLDEPLWNVLRHHVHTKKIFVWIHGFEIQPWYRRDFNNDTDQQRLAAQKESTARIAFWRGLLEEMPANLSLIFVSRMFAEQVMEDIGVRIPPEKYRVIHNPIDTTLFVYHPKPPEQRKKILSISSYATRVYANDLSVRAIQSLANRPWFGELEFRFVGDGRLFDEVLAPLRQFGNVVIERRFLSPDELRDMYREYGVFLCPKRFDSHGVSRDEAMASGLVPVTSAVGAIPEFVNAECGVLAPPENFAGLAAGIESLFLDESRFATMSLNASRRVRRQSDIDSIVAKEMRMFGSVSPLDDQGRLPPRGSLAEGDVS
jgi:glycosyltransferase involved in cell wall biosynthesis